MSKKFIATIMNRKFLGDDTYIFYPSHTEIGMLDEENGIFKDRNENEYFSITNPYALRSEEETCYANIEKLDNIQEITGCESMRDAIADYDYRYKHCIYYVSTIGENVVFSLPIDLDNMKTSLENALYAASMGMMQEDGETNDEERAESDHITPDDIRSDIASFFMNMIDGVYSLDELKELRSNILAQRDDIDALIDSIDLQIEASEYGESTTKLKDEEKIVRKKRSSNDAKKVTVPHYLDIEDLFKKVTKTLIAQDEPTRRVLVEIARKEQSQLNNDRGILITGSTGSGKTKMMELIAKYLDRPFLKVDSTQLTVPGYVGKDIEEVLWDLYVKCGKDKEKAEHAIVFFDEIDKKGSSKKDDISGKGVLNVLLPFFDGSTYDACESVKLQREVVKINTRDMLIILGGAFEDVYKDLRTSRGIGFNASSVSTEATRKATTQDFVDKAKMPSEFMGRVAIVKLNDLTVSDIKRILLESDESAIKIQERLFRELGVKLTPSEDYLNEIAEQAHARNTGARGLNTVVDESTWEAYGDAYTHLGKYDEIILKKETVNDPKQYTKIKRKNKVQN